MKHVGIKQARQVLSNLIDRAEAGEEVVITRQGKPVAKIVAASNARKPLPSLADFRAKLGTKSGTSAAKILREERDAT